MEFGNFAKTQGILFAKVVNSMILKIQDIAIIAAKFSKFSKLVLHIYEIVTNFLNWHRDNFQSNRENTGTKQIGFEWGPCRLL